MNQEARSVPFQMRMQPSVKRAGEVAARDDNRSLSSLLETLLIAHLRAKGYLPLADPPTGSGTSAKGPSGRLKSERARR
jgi:hypothetical protein